MKLLVLFLHRNPKIQHLDVYLGWKYAGNYSYLFNSAVRQTVILSHHECQNCCPHLTVMVCTHPSLFALILFAHTWEKFLLYSRQSLHWSPKIASLQNRRGIYMMLPYVRMVQPSYILYLHTRWIQPMVQGGGGLKWKLPSVGVGLVLTTPMSPIVNSEHYVHGGYRWPV